MTLPGDTGRAGVPLRPQEMDAAAYFVRNQGYSPEHFGLEPVSVVLPESGGEREPVGESTLGVSTDLPAELQAEPSAEPTVEREPESSPEPTKLEQAAAPDTQAKPHAIVWKSFPRPRS